MLVVHLSTLKITGRGGLPHSIMTLWVQLRPPGGGGVTYAQIALPSILEEGKVLFVLVKRNIGILRLRLILTQKFSKSQTLLLEGVQRRANLRTPLLLIKLAL